MSVILKKHTWLKTRSELPGRLEIDRVYFIADEGVFVLDHGAGPVEFGGKGGGGDTFYRGAFADPAALRAAYPTDEAGAYATVLSTGTLWIWYVSDWTDSGKPQTEVEIVDNLVTAASDKALSARQGKVLDEKITELNGEVQNKASAVTLSASIAPEAWTEDPADTTGYPWYADITNAAVTGSMIPFLALGSASIADAAAAVMSSAAQAMTGKVRVFAAHKPAKTLTGTLTLLLPNGEILVDNDFATDEEVHDAIGPIWNGD